jgi:hypothetical protein
MWGKRLTDRATVAYKIDLPGTAGFGISGVFFIHKADHCYWTNISGILQNSLLSVFIHIHLSTTHKSKRTTLYTPADS